MLFMVHTHDKPGALDIRLANRPAHLDWLTAAGKAIKAAGPWLGADDKPAGSLLIVEMESRAALDAWLAQDPYAIAGLFQSVEAAPYKWVFNPPADLNP
ncbi:MAG: hypothetical protein ACI82N_001111 [Maricaulis sp.]|jgi:uncharacterized protein YciI